MSTLIEEKRVERVVERTMRRVLRGFFPFRKNKQKSTFTELLQDGGSFDFLCDEPDIYTLRDVCKKAQ